MFQVLASTVAFLVPAEMNDNNLSVAAFVGDDYPNNLQHVVVTIDRNTCDPF